MPWPTPAALPHERARLLLIGAFALSGVLSFSWLARIPGVRDQLDVTPAELGVILLIGSIGALVTVFAGPALLARFGSARLFAAGTVVTTVGFALVGLGPTLASQLVFGLGILVNGVGGSLLTVPMNVESARIERAHGRSVIPHFHAAFSAGAVGGSILGAVAAAADVPLLAQFVVVGVVTGALRLLAVPAGMIMPGGDPTPAQRPGPALPAGSLGVWAEPRSLLVGVVAFAAALTEGAANNWLSLSFVDGFGSSEAFGGLVLGVFIGAMAVMRVGGTRAIDRIGRVATLRLSCLLAVLGLLAFGLASHPQLALAGVALMGAGAALSFPIAVAAASDEPRLAPARVSMMASLGSVAVMTAAPLIGVVASALGGPRRALLVAVVPLVAALLVSRRVAPPLTCVADPRDVLASRAPALAERENVLAA